MRRYLLFVLCLFGTPGWATGDINAFAIGEPEDPCAPDPILQGGKAPVVVDKVACTFRDAWKNSPPQTSVPPTPAPSRRATRQQRRAQRKGVRRSGN